MRKIKIKDHSGVGASLVAQLVKNPPVAQLVKNPPAMQETPTQFLGQEVPLENSSILGLPLWLRW